MALLTGSFKSDDGYAISSGIMSTLLDLPSELLEDTKFGRTFRTLQDKVRRQGCWLSEVRF